jgi:hypothetical protein
MSLERRSSSMPVPLLMTTRQAAPPQEEAKADDPGGRSKQSKKFVPFDTNLVLTFVTYMVVWLQITEPPVMSTIHEVLSEAASAISIATLVELSLAGVFVIGVFIAFALSVAP